MADRVVLLSSRRGYEFRPDELRLTMLSTGEVQRRISAAFDFQAVEMGTPSETFGPVPTTDPPGLIFSMGTVAYPDGRVTPIRFLHVEAQRVVIDVAGPSPAIDVVWEKLLAIVRDVRSPDDAPSVGEPVRRLENSHFTCHLDFAPDMLLGMPLRRVFRDVFAGDEEPEPLTVVPVILFQVQQPDQIYGGVNGASAFRLELRAGERADANIYFSSAPLPSEVHLAYLDQLETLLSSPAS